MPQHPARDDDHEEVEGEDGVVVAEGEQEPDLVPHEPPPSPKTTAYTLLNLGSLWTMPRPPETTIMIEPVPEVVEVYPSGHDHRARVQGGEARERSRKLAMNERNMRKSSPWVGFRRTGSSEACSRPIR